MKFFVGVLISSLGAAASSGTGMEVFPGFNLDMTFNSKTSLVEFTFVIPDGTWMGLVLGSSGMINANMIQV